MTALAIVASVVGGVVSAAGAMAQGRAEQQAAEYNASISRANAVVADQNRQLSVKAAQVEADEKRRENRRTLSAIRAAYGSSGLELAGSPLDVLADTAAETEVDAQRIEYQGRLQNREDAQKVISFYQDASLSTARGKNAMVAARYNAASSFLGGVSNAANIAGSSLSRTG